MGATPSGGAAGADFERSTSVFVTARALATYWGVHVETVYRAIRSGRLRAYRLPGGALRIRRQEVLKMGRCAPL